MGLVELLDMLALSVKEQYNKETAEGRLAIITTLLDTATELEPDAVVCHMALVSMKATANAKIASNRQKRALTISLENVASITEEEVPDYALQFSVIFPNGILEGGESPALQRFYDLFVDALYDYAQNNEWAVWAKNHNYYESFLGAILKRLNKGVNHDL